MTTIAYRDGVMAAVRIAILVDPWTGGEVDVETVAR